MDKDRDAQVAGRSAYQVAPAAQNLVIEALHSVRTLLGMEVAFVSEFRDGRRIFRYVDCTRPVSPIFVGGSDPVEETYCQRILDGRLPELLEDAMLNHEAINLPITANLGIGVYLGVPIRFSDGSLYGTFCCFSAQAADKPNDHHLTTLRLFSDFVGRVLEKELDDPHKGLRARLDEILTNHRWTVFYQPIVNIKNNTVVGHEALTRFLYHPERPPDQWFLDAALVGCEGELEIAVIKKAVMALSHFPSDTYLSLNASPATILSKPIHTVLTPLPLERLVIEITEHALVNDYLSIAAQLDPLRERGLRVAVDDAGAGYASFRHILKIKPDIIKLDSSLIQRIDTDQDARALSAALIRFSEETNSNVVAEGVETEAEMQVLRDLNVTHAQGYFLGRPAPVPEGGSRLH